MLALSSMHPDYPNLLVGIGASAGGLRPLVEIVDLLSHGYQGAILIDAHRAPDIENQLATIVRKHSRLRVSEPIESEKLSCTHIYVPHPGEILTVKVRRHSGNHRLNTVVRRVRQRPGR